jgi:hypothetical protein
LSGGASIDSFPQRFDRALQPLPQRRLGATLKVACENPQQARGLRLSMVNGLRS